MHDDSLGADDVPLRGCCGCVLGDCVGGDEVERMSDLIDRQDAIDALTRTMVSIPTAGGKDLMHDENRIREEDILVIKRLPSAEPKKGKWIPHCEMSREYFGTVLVNVEYDYWFCDTCGYRVEKGRPMYNFCPNCGTRMED